MIRIFFTTALLLVWQVKAQIHASQVVDFARQLKSQNTDVRISAAEALARIEPEAKEAAPALITTLKDQDAEVRRPAGDALARIGPEAKEAAPALVAALKDQDEMVRSNAADALERVLK